MTMIKLETLHLGDVLNAQVRASRLTWDEVAVGVGWSTSNVDRIQNPSDNYWPTLPTIVKFCLVTRSTLILDHLQARVAAEGFEAVPEAVDCEGLVFEMGGLFRELGDVAREGERAVADRNIDPGEARRLIRELYDVINRAMGLIRGLRVVHGEGRS